MKQRLIDANKIPNYKYKVAARAGDKESLCEFRVAHWKDIEEMPTVDPETLPIVQELREQLKRVAQERDAAVEQLRGDCEKCAYYKVTWNGCTPDFECPLSDRCLNRDMWKWKGLQEDE